MATIGRKYTFPNVSINETIVGPTQFVSNWRNTIGVAAPFSRGPLLANISSRQELISLFGEDRSLGSTFIRQAILQGATNFVVSRVIPTSKPASSAISLQSTTPQSSAAIVGNGDRRTIGLKLDFSSIGNPVSSGPYQISTTVSGAPAGAVTVNKDTFLSDAFNFNGIGYLNIFSHSYDEVRGNTESPIPDDGYSVLSTLTATEIAVGSREITILNSVPGATNFGKLHSGCRIYYGSSEANATTLLGTVTAVTRTGTDVSGSLTITVNVPVAKTPTAGATLKVLPPLNHVRTYVVPDAGYEIGANSSFLAHRAGNNITAGVKLITFSKTETGAANFSKLYPGCRLYYDNPAAGEKYLLAGKVLSHAFTLSTDSTKWGFFVNIETALTALTGTTGELKVVPPTMGSADDWGRVFTVSYSGYQGTDLPDAVFLKEDGRDSRTADIMARTNLETQESIIGYFFLSDNQLLSDTVANRQVTIKYITQEEGEYSLANTEVVLTFPKGYVVPNRSFSVSIMKEQVLVGETDTSLTNPHNSSKAFRPGTNSAVILDNLKDALYANPSISEVLDNVELSLNTLPYALSYTTKEVGSYGNNIKYKLTRVLGGTEPAGYTGTPGDGEDVTDIRFMNGSNILHNGAVQSFVGGAIGATTAELVIYASNALNTPLIYIRALSPGSFANNISVSIKRINKGRFDLEVEEILPNATTRTKLPKEVYTLSNYSVDTASGLYPETLDSKLIRAYFIPILETEEVDLPVEILDLSPSRLAPIVKDGFTGLDNASTIKTDYSGEQYLSNLRLSGGSEPAELDGVFSEQSYIEAIDRLRDQDVSIISAPGLVAGDIRYTEAIYTLINQADDSSPVNGLRIAVLAAPPRLSLSRAKLIGNEFNSPRLVIVGGWSSLSSERSVSLRSVGPEGIYAGRLATEDTYISPSSSYSGRSVFGVRSLDTSSDLNSLDIYTVNNIEMLYLDKVTNSIKFLNGRTTAKDLTNRWVAIRRQSDHLIMSLYINLQWARSAPNNSEVRNRVAAACDAVLKSELRRGAISGHSPTIVNSSDSLRLAQGYMDIIIEWAPVYPADYIDVNITRSVTSAFSLFTA